jgi:hypothetical protein
MPALHMGKHVGQGFLRRHLVQIAALTVAVVAVAVLAVVAFRPSGGGRGVGAVRSPVTSRPVASANPRVDEVKAVARQYLEAFWESAKTGDTSAVDALTEKDSQAYGRAALNARISKSEQHNFVAARVDIDEASWIVDVTATQATVVVSFRMYGHDADWPSLRAREPDHETNSLHSTFQMVVNGQQWLVYNFS